MFEHTVAVQLRHLNIQQNQVEIVRSRQVHGLLAVFRHFDIAVAFLLEVSKDQGAVELSILDHEDGVAIVRLDVLCHLNVSGSMSCDLTAATIRFSNASLEIGLTKYP